MSTSEAPGKGTAAAGGGGGVRGGSEPPAAAWITDTLSGRRIRVPARDPVGVYLCGVTTYDEAHIGHARTIVVFDVLRRYLEFAGRSVRLIQNFTDIDDKIIGRAAAEGVTAAEISERYIGRYHRDFDRLGVRRASAYPRATEHVGEMVSLIRDLVDRGAAYAGPRGVYYSVSGFSGYGKLSKKMTGELRAGARVEVDEGKRDPLDFALWKLADSGPRWDSPWGKGRPGWHVECSAMCMRYLGGGVDIHGGGRDLIFPHHENEIAQSEAHTGGALAGAWMHVGMVTIDGQKMSKSLGNMRSVGRAIDEWGPNAVRLFCLSGHYSKPVDYTDGLMEESLGRWRQVEAAYSEAVRAQGTTTTTTTATATTTTAAAPGRAPGAAKGSAAHQSTARFMGWLGADLNTHEAVSEMLALAREINGLAAEAEGGLDAATAASAGREIERQAGVLGLRLPDASPAKVAEIEGMVARREELRRGGSYVQADALRNELAARGVELIDRGSGTSWIMRGPAGTAAAAAARTRRDS